MLDLTKIAMTDSFHKVFLTGGTGYIGSHTCVELLIAGMDVMLFDNFCNSHPLALARATQITGKKPTVEQGDVIQESATFGTALRPSGASEAMLFVRLSHWVSQFKSRWPITITMWQAA